jgi:hypothetical protein
VSRDSTAGVPLEEIVDQCVDEIASGRVTVEQALARWPEQRDSLAPLLEVAMAMRELPPIEERAPNPERRASFMEAIASTPQEAAPQARERSGGWFGGLVSAFPRFAALAAPAAAIAVVALFFVLSTGGTSASASTLTVFEGAVERFEDGTWRPIADGASLSEGDQLRTTGAGMALVTFVDGSTAALDPSTEVTDHAGATHRADLERRGAWWRTSDLRGAHG